MTPASVRRTTQRRVVMALALMALWLFAAPVARTLFDLSPEGLLVYRLSALFFLAIPVVSHIRASGSRT